MDWLSASLTLATEVFKYINTAAARKYLDRKVKLELELQQEEAKPYDQQDDAKIMALKKEAIVIIQAAAAEMQIHQAGK